jgi:hypothetical protein
MKNYTLFKTEKATLDLDDIDKIWINPWKYLKGIRTICGQKLCIIMVLDTAIRSKVCYIQTKRRTG